MIAYFNRFDLELSRAEARAASASGPVDSAVATLTRRARIQAQLATIPDPDLTAELGEFGAWSPDELADRGENERRIVWVAAGQIREGTAGKWRSRRA